MQSVLHNIDLLFQSALMSAERSVLLRLFLAQYVHWYRNNSYVEMLHLKALDQVRGRGNESALHVPWLVLHWHPLGDCEVEVVVRIGAPEPCNE